MFAASATSVTAQATSTTATGFVKSQNITVSNTANNAARLTIELVNSSGSRRTMCTNAAGTSITTASVKVSKKEVVGQIQALLSAAFLGTKQVSVTSIWYDDGAGNAYCEIQSVKLGT